MMFGSAKIVHTLKFWIGGMNKMSMNYCETHDTHYDEDFNINCPQCENEIVFDNESKIKCVPSKYDLVGYSKMELKQ